MTITYILVLAIIQGLTEFLPVSSSAHLALAPKLVGEADQGQVMDAAMHMGTLLAALIYYRRDVFEIVTAVLKWSDPKRKAARNLGIYIALSSIPALAFGFAIHYVAEHHEAIKTGLRSIGVIATTTLLFGILMGVADKKGSETKGIGDITLRQALIIGCAQALAAIFPGVSRSGITMTAARFMNFKRVDAARFSFLLGMPATAAAASLSFYELFKSGDAVVLHEGMIAAVMTFFFGLAAIYFMIKWLKRFGLMPYVVYRILLAGFLFAKFIVFA